MSIKGLDIIILMSIFSGNLYLLGAEVPVNSTLSTAGVAQPATSSASLVDQDREEILSDNQLTPLHVAALNGQVQAIRVLLGATCKY